MNDTEIYKIAAVLTDHYKDRKGRTMVIASALADHSLRCGDIARCSIWKRISVAILKFQSEVASLHSGV
jgi:hypothetical protein